jgi:LPS O-antigen subunit length determinant protein (WzzB/FepE family)
MKKNNTYLAEDEINLRDLIKLLLREKILILFISIICGLAGYLFILSKPQEFRIEIQIKNPPSQLFEPYKDLFTDNINSNTSIGINHQNYNRDYHQSISMQFISDFKLNFLSLDNLESFVVESKEFDNFKGYLKSRNISAKEYFVNKMNEKKVEDLIIPNKYFLVYTKELNGDIFLINYVQFIKKKTIDEIKKNLKLSIETKLINVYEAIEKARLVNLTNPLLTGPKGNQVVQEPTDLFYKGTKVLEQEIISLKKLLIKLENDQFNFDIILEKPFSSVQPISRFKYFAIGVMLGLFLSLGIIFFKGILK